MFYSQYRGALLVAIYLVDCIDGSDSNCWGELEVGINIEGLSVEQLKEITQHGRTCITKEQLKSSGIEVSAMDEKALEEMGCLEVRVFLDSCGACSPDDLS